MRKTIIRFDKWIKEEEMRRETLCTLGNGVICTRESTTFDTDRFNC